MLKQEKQRIIEARASTVNSRANMMDRAQEDIGLQVDRTTGGVKEEAQPFNTVSSPGKQTKRWGYGGYTPSGQGDTKSPRSPRFQDTAATAPAADAVDGRATEPGRITAAPFTAAGKGAAQAVGAQAVGHTGQSAEFDMDSTAVGGTTGASSARLVDDSSPAKGVNGSISKTASVVAIPESADAERVTFPSRVSTQNPKASTNAKVSLDGGVETRQFSVMTVDENSGAEDAQSPESYPKGKSTFGVDRGKSTVQMGSVDSVTLAESTKNANRDSNGNRDSNAADSTLNADASASVSPEDGTEQRNSKSGFVGEGEHTAEVFHQRRSSLSGAGVKAKSVKAAVVPPIRGLKSTTMLDGDLVSLAQALPSFNGHGSSSNTSNKHSSDAIYQLPPGESPINSAHSYYSSPPRSPGLMSTSMFSTPPPDVNNSRNASRISQASGFLRTVQPPPPHLQTKVTRNSSSHLNSASASQSHHLSILNTSIQSRSKSTTNLAAPPSLSLNGLIMNRKPLGMSGSAAVLPKVVMPKPPSLFGAVKGVGKKM
jgi:hypothetical protein